jgi:hypothetical protein
MRRGPFVLLVLLVLFAVAGCSDEGSPTVGEPDGSTSTTSTSEPSTTSSTSPVSTTTPEGEGVALTGPVGSGRVVYSVAADRSEFCYQTTVEGVPAATGSHLHRASDDEVVLELQPPSGDGTVNTCSAADAILVEQLQTSPSDFVLDVHTAKGTLRATL